MRLRRVFGVWAMVSAVMSGCGPSSNLNGILFSGSAKKESYEALMAKARIQYDRGEFSDAISLAQKAQELGPDAEQPAILIGYSYLSMAGLDPFKIASKLIKESDKSKDSSKSSSSKLLEDSSSSSSGAGDTLKNLGSILIDVNTDDYDKLGTKSVSSVSLFSANSAKYDLLIPKKPGSTEDSETPRSAISALAALNHAIAAICPFVDDSSSVKRSDDARHKCTPTTVTRHSKAKSHYLWAISHLSEALFFSSVLLYSGDKTSTSTNLLNRVTALSDKTAFPANGTGIVNFVKAVKEVKDGVGSIFDSSSDSMLTAILNDMNTAVGGFGAIPGMPEGVTKQVQSALDSVSSAAEKISTTVDSTSGSSSTDSKTAKQVAALKGQMNTKVATQLKTEIDKLATSNKTEFEKGGNACNLCSAYTALSDGIPSATAPSACSGVSTTSCASSFRDSAEDEESEMLGQP